MKYSTTTSVASRCAGSCVIVGIYNRGKLGEAATDIDKASKGLIRKQIKSGDLSGRLGNSRMLGSIDGVKAQRVFPVNAKLRRTPLFSHSLGHFLTFVG